MRAHYLVGLLAIGCAQEILVNDRDAGPLPRDGGPAAVRDAGETVRDAGQTARDAGANGRDGGVVARDAGPRDGGETITCIVDPFDPCDDPDEAMRTNNEWSDASAFHTTSVGCQTGDEFEAFDGVQSSRMCQSEPADFYRLTVVPCDTITMRTEIRLSVDMCPADRWSLAFFRGGGRQDCNDPNDGLTCTEEDGDQVIRFFVPPGNSILSWQVAVESDFQDVLFDYDLSISISR